MQALVYIFIGLIGLAIAAAAFFGLTFTPIEAALAGCIAAGLCVIVLERTLRRRAEARFERAIEEFSRLLSTDAQAGQVLSQRINELADLEIGERMQALEGDMSVLGTVVQQVAEAVAELEKTREPAAPAQPAPAAGNRPRRADDGFETQPAADFPAEPDTLLNLRDVQRAVEQQRLVFHVQPVVTLPQRRTVSYDLLPRIELENGEFVNALDFTPRKGGDGLVQHIEQLALQEAFAIVRRGRSAGETALINIPLSRATLSDPGAVERMLPALDKGRQLAKDFVFVVSERHWRGFNAMERNGLANIAERCAGLSISGVNTLRFDFSELAANGVTSIRVEATRFINQPETYTDFHSADIVAYIARYEIDLIVGAIRSEQQILSLLEDGVRFAQGPHVAPAGPMPASFPLGAAFSMPEKRMRLRS